MNTRTLCIAILCALALILGAANDAAAGKKKKKKKSKKSSDCPALKLKCF